MAEDEGDDDDDDADDGDGGEDDDHPTTSTSIISFFIFIIIISIATIIITTVVIIIIPILMITLMLVMVMTATLMTLTDSAFDICRFDRNDETVKHSLIFFEQFDASLPAVETGQQSQELKPLTEHLGCCTWRHQAPQQSTAIHSTP